MKEYFSELNDVLNAYTFGDLFEAMQAVELCDQLITEEKIPEQELIQIRNLKSILESIILQGSSDEKEAALLQIKTNLAEGKEEALIAIRGQYGTLDVSGLYPGPPETFLTDQGREAQYYKQEYASDQGEVFIDRYLVFGQLDSGFYGVSIQMPRSVFDRNEEAIQTLLKSIRITEE